MSEFNCPEPGCTFHIGIAGDLVTAEDFEAQDYYDQEIEEHQRMHEKQMHPQPLLSDFDLLLNQVITAAEVNLKEARGNYDLAAHYLAFEVSVGGDLREARHQYLSARDRHKGALGAVETLRNLKTVLSSAQRDEGSTDGVNEAKSC
ncbi:hypothetical protein [Glutamicibacter sp. TV12E]|uniref:hypothetical protein n=1 Tax=Glutamicibacter sp. TV12E TaxID=3446362 RepID=UPI004033AE9E